jgi:predicted RNase H-like HicB family nuclease
MKDNYSMIARWSEADSRYLAFVPELPGCIADGETLEEATHELVLALKDWLETAKELGMDIPLPVTREDAAKPSPGTAAATLDAATAYLDDRRL